MCVCIYIYIYIYVYVIMICVSGIVQASALRGGELIGFAGIGSASGPDDRFPSNTKHCGGDRFRDRFERAHQPRSPTLTAILRTEPLEVQRFESSLRTFMTLTQANAKLCAKVSGSHIDRFLISCCSFGVAHSLFLTFAHVPSDAC